MDSFVPFMDFFVVCPNEGPLSQTFSCFLPKTLGIQRHSAVYYQQKGGTGDV